MKKTLIILFFILTCLELQSQCYNAYDELPLQPSLQAGYSVRKSKLTSFQLYYITQTKTIATSVESTIFSTWNGIKWTNLKEFSLANGEMNLLSWNSRLIAWGNANKLDDISAPNGKYIAFAEFKNGQWDTLRGGVFNSSDYKSYSAYGTNKGLYISVIDNISNQCDIFVYDTVDYRFVKLFNCSFNMGAPIHIQSGTNTLLVGGISQLDTIKYPGFCRILGDSIAINKNKNLHTQFRFSIDGKSDLIYAFMFGWGNRTIPIYETDDSISRMYETIGLRNYSNVKVFKGKIICQNSFADPTKYDILCYQDKIWTPFNFTGYNTINLSDLDVTENGFFIYDFKFKKVLNLQTGNQVSGISYLDINQNCKFESGSDVLLKNVAITLKSTKLKTETTTDSNGRYSAIILPGTTSIYGPGLNVSCSVNQFEFTQLDSNYIIDQPRRLPTLTDISIQFIQERNLRLAAKSIVWVKLQNHGLSCDSITITLDIDSRLKFIDQKDNNITSISNSKAIAKVKNFGYYKTQIIAFEIYADTSKLKLNDTVCFKASAFPNLIDADSTSNVSQYCSNIVYSMDPNFISCNKKKIPELKATKLEYEIGFQNEGNDDAIDVMLVDSLTQQFNMMDIIDITNSTHPYTIKIENNIMTMFFKNIHLAPKELNENLSMGNIKYTIFCKNILNSGDSINNRAAIYFDLNEPVYTNNSIVKITPPTLIHSSSFIDNVIFLYPNPANQYIELNLDKKSNYMVKISNISGQKMHESNYSENTQIDICNLFDGMYIVHIYDIEKNKSFSIKFIKN